MLHRGQIKHVRPSTVSSYRANISCNLKRGNKSWRRGEKSLQNPCKIHRCKLIQKKEWDPLFFRLNREIFHLILESLIKSEIKKKERGEEGEKKNRAKSIYIVYGSDEVREARLLIYFTMIVNSIEQSNERSSRSIL